jgi:long-chain acyl-CoA synthetase
MIYRDKIRETVRKFSNEVSTICDKKGPTTFGELNQKSNALVHGFHEKGLVKGDKIAFLCGNCHHYREMFWVAGKAGFILVPVNMRLKPREMTYIIDNAEAVAMVISSDFVQIGQEIRQGLPNINHFFCLDAEIDGYEYLGDFDQRFPTDDVEVELTQEDMMWLQYTSGTTGLPKGAIHTQGTAAALIDLCYEEIKSKGLYEAGTRALQLLPSYSYSSIAFDLIYQAFGTLVVILPEFDAGKMMALIEKHKITDCHIVPVILSFLLNSPDFGKYDLSSLECITYGAAPMPPELLSQGMKQIGSIFMQDYGCSEAGAFTFLDIEDHVLEGPPEKVRRLASCGKPFPGADVRVLNEAGEDVKPGEIGELTTKSGMVMPAYWKLPEETEKTLVDGRFYTGDLCTVDEEGYIFLKDRKKDMIISGGFNIYPFELESVLMEHSAVLDTAVVGIPDEQWGEAVCAFVVLREGESVTEEDIIEFMKDNLASYKKAKRVEFTDQIPRTLTGKILKRELRADFWKDRDRQI